MGPASRDEAVSELREQGLSVSRACKLTNTTRSSYYYKSCRDDSDLIEALQQLAAEHPSYGFRKCYAMLRRQGRPDNRKRVYRVYRLLKLNLRRRKGKRSFAGQNQAAIGTAASNQSGLGDGLYE